METLGAKIRNRDVGGDVDVDVGGDVGGDVCTWKIPPRQLGGDLLNSCICVLVASACVVIIVIIVLVPSSPNSWHTEKNWKHSPKPFLAKI